MMVLEGTALKFPLITKDTKPLEHFTLNHIPYGEEEKTLTKLNVRGKQDRSQCYKRVHACRLNTILRKVQLLQLDRLSSGMFSCLEAVQKGNTESLPLFLLSLLVPLHHYTNKWRMAQKH